MSVCYTALDSIKEGFETSLIIDASRGLNEDAIAKALQNIRSEGGQII